ncbi:MAG TPA: histidine phosphatase family protein [Solirubrobacteraceae bacterium]|nr:histidine phosphatase family protein [Solirubrobacteraceae bacterium]
MLWLLRHAEAADGVPDDERPLTDRGRAQARAAGRALARGGYKLELCLSSPKVRARETAELACEPLGIEIRLEPALSGPPFEATELTAGVEHVLLVGHDPSFSMTLHDLTGTQARMAKGGLAAIRKGELIVLMRPLEIAAVAGETKDA